MSLCRTRALGGHEYQCNACESTCSVYNSCGDRHCSQCSGSKRYDFCERASKVLLAGVDYYQVVFTLPSELSRLALSNRGSLADLLFKTAWKSLNQTVQSEQDYDPAAIMVLHTWNQKLEAHWHVHAIVPGAGPSRTDGSWKTSTAPPGSGLRDDRYLVDAINLRTSFRKHAMTELARLRKRGELKLGIDPEFGDLRTDVVWDAFTSHLESLEWVSYIEPPPPGSSGPSNLVRYLTRYLTGGPIGNSRIESADEAEVTFMAREGSKQGGGLRQVPLTLETPEFVRRWCLHIQPDQLTKTRYFGGWSNSKLSRYQASCQRAMPSASMSLSPATAATILAATEESTSKLKCPTCESTSLRKIESWPRPSWRSLIGYQGSSTPVWYRESREKDDERFWDGCYGAGFNAWYLENVIESAFAPPPGKQLLLPGLELLGVDAID